MGVAPLLGVGGGWGDHRRCRKCRARPATGRCGPPPLSPPHRGEGDPRGVRSLSGDAHPNPAGTPSPLWGGLGWGSHHPWELAGPGRSPSLPNPCGASAQHRETPTPNPSPQGGGGHPRCSQPLRRCSPKQRGNSLPPVGRAGVGVAPSVGIGGGRGKHRRCQIRAGPAPDIGRPPPLTPPHRGEGDTRGVRSLSGDAHPNNARTPSPLWGGLGWGSHHPWESAEAKTITVAAETPCQASDRPLRDPHPYPLPTGGRGTQAVFWSGSRPVRNAALRPSRRGP